MRKHAALSIFRRLGRGIWGAGQRAVPLGLGAGAWYGAERLEDATGIQIHPEEKAIAALMGLSVGTRGARHKFLGGEHGDAAREARRLGKKGFKPRYWRPVQGGWELDLPGDGLSQRLVIKRDAQGRGLREDVRAAREAINPQAAKIFEEELFQQLKRKVGLGLAAAGARSLRSIGESTEAVKRMTGAVEESLVGLSPQEQAEYAEIREAGDGATDEQKARLKELDEQRKRAVLGSVGDTVDTLKGAADAAKSSTRLLSDTVKDIKKSDAQIAIDYLADGYLNHVRPVKMGRGEHRRMGPWELKDYGVDSRRGAWGDWHLDWVSPDGEEKNVTFRYWQADPATTEANKEAALKGLVQYRKDHPTAAEQVTKPMGDLVGLLKEVALYGGIGLGGLALLYTVLRHTTGSGDEEEGEGEARDRKAQKDG